MRDVLIEQLRDARRVTLAMVEDLADEQMTVSRLDIVNPFLWELGHVAFFHDAFVLGYLDGSRPMLKGAGRIYDSFKVDHDDRWDLPLPDRNTTLDYLQRVATAVELVAGESRASYCCNLALRHEDMHGEAFFFMRQTLGYSAPSSCAIPDDASGPLPGDVPVSGGTFRLGADPEAVSGAGPEADPEAAGEVDSRVFAFDNEKWAHPVDVADFQIARAPVTNAEFAAFVDDGGYDREELWTRQGWVWRQKASIAGPCYWKRGSEGWCQRQFDADVPLAPHRPVTHVGWYEARAFCEWAGRRLPTEAEWEMAASIDPSTGDKRRFPWGDDEPSPTHANLDLRLRGPVDVAAHPDGDSAVGCRQMAGNVWEWTADAFYPFPGYVVDLPYREYSAPWFGYRKVLKGGAFTTRGRLAYNTFRNFYLPDRCDVFTGFRTCAR